MGNLRSVAQAVIHAVADTRVNAFITSGPQQVHDAHRVGSLAKAPWLTAWPSCLQPAIFSAFTIHGVPKRSSAMPKPLAQKVAVKGICT